MLGFLQWFFRVVCSFVLLFLWPPSPLPPPLPPSSGKKTPFDHWTKSFFSLLSWKRKHSSDELEHRKEIEYSGESSFTQSLFQILSWLASIWVREHTNTNAKVIHYLWIKSGCRISFSKIYIQKRFFKQNVSIVFFFEQERVLFWFVWYSWFILWPIEKKYAESCSTLALWWNSEMVQIDIGLSIVSWISHCKQTWQFLLLFQFMSLRLHEEVWGSLFLRWRGSLGEKLPLNAWT